MRKTFGWIAMLIASSAVLAVPAQANDKNDDRYANVSQKAYYAPAPRYGHESRERLDRERRARLERERREHRGWDRNAWR
jgi:hypothetical protein